jgi:hypothetical protein
MLNADKLSTELVDQVIGDGGTDWDGRGEFATNTLIPLLSKSKGFRHCASRVALELMKELVGDNGGPDGFKATINAAISWGIQMGMLIQDAVQEQSQLEELAKQ